MNLLRSISRNIPSNVLIYTYAVSLIFFLLALNRIGVPTGQYYDEIYYIPAARKILNLDSVMNREHPMLAKELMAVAIACFGDHPFAWRIGSLISGTLTVFFSMRTLWIACQSARVVKLFGLLLLSNFLLFSVSRVGILDSFMIMFATLSFWSFSVAIKGHSEYPAAWYCWCGAFLGLSIACKWSSVFLFPILAITFLIGNKFSIKNITISSIYFVFIPIVVYFATFIPAFFVSENPISFSELGNLQYHMWKALSYPRGRHPYGSVWWEWPLGLGTMWWLRADVDGLRYIIVLGQNPLSSILALPSILIGLWLSIKNEERFLLFLSVCYILSLIFWSISGRSLQFLYYYLLSSILYLAVLSYIMGKIWDTHRKIVIGIVSGCFVLFIWFYPALTAAALHKSDEKKYTWLPGWMPQPNLEQAFSSRHREMKTENHLLFCLNHPTDKICPVDISSR